MYRSVTIEINPLVPIVAYVGNLTPNSAENTDQSGENFRVICCLDRDSNEFPPDLIRVTSEEHDR